MGTTVKTCQSDLIFFREGPALAILDSQRETKFSFRDFFGGQMNRRIQISILFASSLFLAACSGSSGSSSNTSGQPSSSQSGLASPMGFVFNSSTQNMLYGIAVDLVPGQRFLARPISESETKLGVIFTTYPIDCSSNFSEVVDGLTMAFVIDREDGLAWKMLYGHRLDGVNLTGSHVSASTLANIYFVDSNVVQGELTYEIRDSSDKVTDAALGDFTVKNCSSLQY